MKGQTLIEVLIALAVAMLIISAISIAVISALNNAIFSKNQNSATQYAQEGMEMMRRLKNAKWSEFNAYTSGNYCLDDNGTSLRARDGDKCGQNIDTFMREVGVIKSSDPTGSNSSCNSMVSYNCNSANGETQATVSVCWSDGKCRDAVNPFCNKVELISCFSDVNVIQAP